MSFYVLLSLIGLGAGMTTVLFGFGGGFIMVPVLYQGITLAHGDSSAQGQAAMHIAVATSTCLMIFSSLLATRRHHLAGTLDIPVVKPLLLYIALGAILGAAVATVTSGVWLRWFFVLYLGVTILDCLFRPGFVASQRAKVVPMPKPAIATGGTLIGAVASCLGVGGSVMTVPLLRRRGASMTQATAMASPLTVPVSIAGTLSYIVFSWQEGVALGSGYLGYVDLRAFIGLSLGSWIGIQLASRMIGKLPDKLHSRVYIVLLMVFWVAMVVG